MGVGGPPELSPQEAAERWLNKRSVTLAEQTLTDYHYRLKVFTDWVEDRGVESMQDLTPWLVDEFDAKRMGDDLSPITLRNHQQTVRDWLQWAADIGLAPEGVDEAIEIPDVDRADHVSTIKLDTDVGEALVASYRSGPHRASKHHVAFEILWTVGCRMGGLRGLDVGDVDRSANVLEFRHRPETGTPLKNGVDAERDVGVPAATMDVIEEWLQGDRPRVRDEHGRRPLLPTPHGRVAESTLRNWCYYATVPCRIHDCPHGEEPVSCEWFTNNTASACPSSRSPHQVRSGSITWQRHRGMDVEVVSRRVNASVGVIEEHYDLPTKREEFEHREKQHIDKLSLDSAADVESEDTE